MSSPEINNVSNLVGNVREKMVEQVAEDVVEIPRETGLIPAIKEFFSEYPQLEAAFREYRSALLKTMIKEFVPYGKSVLNVVDLAKDFALAFRDEANKMLDEINQRSEHYLEPSDPITEEVDHQPEFTNLSGPRALIGLNQLPERVRIAAFKAFIDWLDREATSKASKALVETTGKVAEAVAEVCERLINSLLHRRISLMNLVPTAVSELTAILHKTVVSVFVKEMKKQLVHNHNQLKEVVLPILREETYQDHIARLDISERGALLPIVLKELGFRESDVQKSQWLVRHFIAGWDGPSTWFSRVDKETKEQMARVNAELKAQVIVREMTAVGNAFFFSFALTTLDEIRKEADLPSRLLDVPI
ncbi:MAG: hypothetical protein KDD67_06525 [Ignavibacteriae bacterium]|nr:hypothetical protein [Ignavibacteriota bacterium]MCB9215591.1 hypothetical protein [Ignavibacteria bacterium]